MHWTGFWAWQLTRERTSLSYYYNERLPSCARGQHGPPLVQYETVLFLWYSTFKRNATVHGDMGVHSSMKALDTGVIP